MVDQKVGNISESRTKNTLTRDWSKIRAKIYLRIQLKYSGKWRERTKEDKLVVSDLIGILFLLLHVAYVSLLNYALHHLSSSLKDLLHEVYEDLFGICHAFLNALQISSHYNMPWKAAATDTPIHTHTPTTTLWPDFYQWQMITMRRASEPQSGLKL